MEINTNPNSIVPLYAQIVESLKRDIENGVIMQRNEFRQRQS